MIEVYAIGLVNASVCVPNGTSRELIEHEVNQRYPTGSTLRWRIAEEQHFADGSSMPGPCDRQPTERQHWLLHC